MSAKDFVKIFYKSDAFSDSTVLKNCIHPTISHIIEENDLISVRYSHFVKTIENPREEMLLAHFMIVWQIKDNKFYKKGYQMSQIPK